jgi:hypothetical protein
MTRVSVYRGRIRPRYPEQDRACVLPVPGSQLRLHMPSVPRIVLVDCVGAMCVGVQHGDTKFSTKFSTGIRIRFSQRFCLHIALTQKSWSSDPAVRTYVDLDLWPHVYSCIRGVLSPGVSYMYYSTDDQFCARA